ncbi:2-C-methyl-D-erythritol 4-phosphate cytidylyltransferase [Mycolicibacterium sp. 018/SC-01/001]|uniref:IspD/TarI family cytidylyltransferase n=1 Tax=Mycolicibacterium sp. 018/SC-01/001 TaxID=2592069 RepID=UPI00117D8CD6|nr:IspD/TarI family cytidylyltransferase [Mycolicibacterium sp. 018/SC-01/001]TRW78849.1 2-C-methyl-D-erythritol 4-phosphate cytidylyltransferase [Mycolicibacterium sp. 018/SC-01/001]
MGPVAVAVVLAAGIGSRVGAGGNKAFLTLDGRSMLVWSLDTLGRVPVVARTVLVYRQGEAELARATVAGELGADTPVEFVEGGATRHRSELNVLRYLAGDIDAGAVDVVLIHDAARPLAGADMFTTAVALARESGGALPALEVTGLARVRAGTAEPLLETTIRVQTPQAFRARDVLDAYRCSERDGFEGTDTSSCVERYTDVEVRTFPGSAANLKVTYPGDIAVAHHLLSAQNRTAGSR